MCICIGAFCVRPFFPFFVCFVLFLFLFLFLFCFVLFFVFVFVFVFCMKGTEWNRLVSVFDLKWFPNQIQKNGCYPNWRNSCSIVKFDDHSDVSEGVYILQLSDSSHKFAQRRSSESSRVCYNRLCWWVLKFHVLVQNTHFHCWFRYWMYKPTPPQNNNNKQTPDTFRYKSLSLH